jgi:DNA-binding CsgD family transcriptional regulator
MVVHAQRPAPVLRGRAPESAMLDELLDAVRAGDSGTLVLRGEPGIGKTALLDYAAARAEGCNVLRVVGFEAEMELPFAAVQRLCMPLLEGLERLPPPQRDALATALGLSAGPRPDRFLVGLAVLSLLANATEAQPLVCLVDDAHWLDHSSAEVISLVARRLQAESVVIVFAERDMDEPRDLAGLPELRLERLSAADARALLEESSLAPIEERINDRIIAEARGNPLALLELPRGLLAAGDGGGPSAPGASLPSRIEKSYRRRLTELPAETRRLLLVAAAEPLGDPQLLRRAASGLGIPLEAAAPAESEGLMEIGGQVVFSHPLLRSAIYRAAPPGERRKAHEALAAATDPALDPDRRAWHRAQSTLAPDEDIAAELESSAERAQGRGAVAAAAAFLERAVELTPEPHRRAQRALAAARAKRLAGLPGAASSLLALAMRGPLDELEDAVAQRLRGEIALDQIRDGEAASLLLDAARRLETLDADLARETYLEAMWAAGNAGRFGAGMGAAAAAARAAQPAVRQPAATDLLVDGLAVLSTDGYADGAAILKRALAMSLEEDGRDERSLRTMRMAARVAAELFDVEAWNDLATRHAQVARELGLLGMLPVTVAYLATLRIHEGRLEAGAALLDEADAISAGAGNPRNVSRLLLTAYRGDMTETSALADVLLREAAARADGLIVSVCDHALAILHNGLGHYERALGAAQAASERDELSVTSWSLPELVEAAARGGKQRAAAEALERLCERTRAAGTDFARGIEARSRALTAQGAQAEDAYREAIELLDTTRMKPALARARLVYGEWLRRENRRVDARGQLRGAFELLHGMGIGAYAERARRELLATGETVRKRTDDARGQLTPQEEHIAQLAADGYTNAEIGAQLFLSSRTVEWHLRKVFTKLGVSSRRQLRTAFR